MSRTAIEALLDKYLKQQTTPQENEMVEQWLISPKEIPSEWEIMEEPDRDLWLNSVLEKIDSTIDRNAVKVVQLQPRSKWWISIASVAAVLVIFLSLFWFSPVFKNTFTPAENIVKVTVPANAKKHIILSDGSKVWVNSGAVFSYAKEFKGKTREVYLSGEAYFDIKHDPEHPFIVHTENVITTVLGTAFNIKTDNLTHQIAVTVTRGKVSVANGQKVMALLTPEQQITFNTATQKHQKTKADVTSIISWLPNELQFTDATFADAALELEQQFNVKINFSNEKLKNCRFTGTAFQHKKLEEILAVLCAFNDATFEKQKNGEILISGKGCN